MSYSIRVNRNQRFQSNQMENSIQQDSDERRALPISNNFETQDDLVKRYEVFIAPKSNSMTILLFCHPENAKSSHMTVFIGEGTYFINFPLLFEMWPSPAPYLDEQSNDSG